MPTTLRAGQAAIISYETDATSVAGGSPDAIRIVLLEAVTAGTIIYLTDRAWNGTSFAAASAGEGTLTINVGPLLAGAVLTFTAAQLTAAGISLSNAGETIYLYQGTGVDAPTTFLFAADIADANTTFDGSLVNTGLTAGINAVAVQHDNARFVGMPAEIAAAMQLNIANNARWNGSDQDDIGGTALYTEVSDTTITNVFSNPEMVLIAGMAGGGQSDAILRIGNDEASNFGSNLTRLFRDNPAFNRIADVTFDIADGVFFFVDSDGNSINRIMRGNIADLVSGNPSPVFTQVFITDNQNNGAGAVLPGEIIVNIEINTATNKIYWMDGDLSGTYEGGFQLWEANYDGTGQRLIQTIDTENVDPNFFFPGGVGDFAVAGNFAYVVSSLGSVDGLGNSTVAQNHILKIDLTSGAVTFLNLGTSPTGYSPGRLPETQGQIIGIDVDTVTGTVWFVTQPISATTSGGIFKFVPGTTVGNVVNGTLTEVWEQPTNNAFNTLQNFPTANMTHIEVDEIGGRLYISATSDNDTEVDGTPATNESDAAIFTLASNAAAGTAPTLFQRVFEPTANGSPTGIEIDYAPITAVVGSNAAYTESTNAPGSGAGTPRNVITSATVTDPDTATLKGATIAITSGFVTGDQLAVNVGATGIVAVVNNTLGLITLSGNATFAQYQAVIASLTFTNAGDNPTNFGANTTRTISVTTFDGLATSDPATATLTVVGINDAPVNTVGGTLVLNEDAGATALVGISINDVDADPATAIMTVTLSVARGTITIATGVANGVTSGQVTGNGTTTITVQATQNAINATLANATGLTYTPTVNINGPDALTITTNDGGATGNDPGLTGTGTTEEDIDTKAITVTAVNDAPVASGSATMAVILEDATPAGQTVAALFSGNFSDATDQVTGGSSANSFVGIVVTNNPASASGVWQHSLNGGTSWVAITTGVTPATGMALDATALVRFLPAANFNGTAPTLTATLVDSSGGALTTGATVNASVTGGTTRFSAAAVTLSQSVTAVNDTPVNTVGGVLTLNEDAAATALTGISIADIDVNPATDIVTVTLSVARGTISLNTAVSGGVTSGQITGNGTAAITVQATQNQINATLANAIGLAYTPTANVNGPDALTITTNDGGATGIDPGSTGTPTSEQDTDTKTIAVVAVNDAPVASGSAAMAVILEDIVSTSGQTVAALFTANFSDTIDDVPAGSTAHALAGIVVTGNPVSANGAWQYFNGSWLNIPTGISATNGFAIAATTAVRFNPATNFNGTAQTLTVTLVDTSAGALTTGATVNASVTGGTTRFSATSVTLAQEVTSVNDAPTSTGLQGDIATTTEPAGAGSVMPNVKIDVGGNATIADVDNANFSGGTLRFAITSGLVAAQDQLVIDTAPATTVTVASGTVSVGGTAIGTVTGGGAGGGDLIIALNANASPTLVQALIRAIDFANTGGDNPTSGSRTITTTLVDGSGAANAGADTRVVTSTVNVVAANDAAVAVDDVNSVLETGSIVGASVFGNDSDPDGPALVVSAANGVAGNVGTQITLASGATFTLRADGTYDYNTNGAFDTLVDAATAAATGAVNSQAFDQFSYTLAGGNTVFVNITVNGVQSAGDQLLGAAGNSTLTGTPGVDTFNLTLGGNDTVTGLGGDDAFNFGATFDAFDTVDGGPGTNDQVGLFGNYSGGIVLGPNTLRNVELLAALPGSGAGYNITSNDGNVAAGQELAIFGGNLLADQPFRFDGRAELDGRFRIFGGLANDTFFGGALDDGFYFGPGKWGAGDSVVGGGGTNDQLALDGNYTVSIGTTADVETLILLPGPVGSPNSFNITLTDAWTAAGATKTVWGLNVTTNMVIDGSAETDGNLVFFGGRGSDTLSGGAGADIIYGGGGGDVLRGNGGADIFRYDNLTDSFGITNATRDRILDFTSGVDKIDLSRIDAIAGGADDAFTFIGTSAFSNVAGQLRYFDNGGGIFIVEGDVDGDGNADFSVSLTTSPPAGPTPFDFIL